MENVDFDNTTQNQKEIKNSHINIGTGHDITIHDLSVLIAKEIGYEGTIIFDSNKPDGTMRKLVDVSKINSLGWKHTIEIEEGVKRIYKWYTNN